MAVGGCYSCMKYLLVVFNFLFWILGIAGIAFSVWMLLDPTFSVSLTQEYNDYMISIIIILVASIILVIVAGLGMYGALKENQCALLTFFSLLLIIFVAEISSGLWAYINSDSLETQVRNAVKLTVEQEYGQNENRKLLFDTFQKNLQCCGAEKPTDWIGNKHVVVAITHDSTVYNIPESCCREHVSQEQCLIATRNLKVTSGIDYNLIYDKGCYTLIMSKLKEHASFVMMIGIGILIIQFLGLIFSLILACAVSRLNRYKS